MKYILLITFIISIGLISCNSDVDDIHPEIDLSIENAFPVNCDTLFSGQSFDLRVRFSDNVALGSFSIEIHNNFDHHTHSTEANSCIFDEDKEAVNAWFYLESFEIPSDQSEYISNISIAVPQDIDTGDYHFQIRLTDHEGWQSLKGLSIKIL